MKKLTYLLTYLLIAILMTGCFAEKKKELEEEKTIEVENVSEYLSDYYLDEGIKRLKIEVPKDMTKRSGKDLREAKRKLIEQKVLESQKRKKRADGELTEEEKIITEITNELKTAIDGAEATVETSNGKFLDLSNEPGYLNGTQITKQDLLSIAAREGESTDKRGMWKCDWTSYFWPFGVVTYMFDEKVPNAIKEDVRAAAKEWSDKSGKVRFKEIPFSSNTKADWNAGLAPIVYINAYNDNKSSNTNGGFGLWRYLDYYYDNSGRVSMSTVRHELGHVLGLEHEHQRYDRDDYVVIDWSLVDTDMKDQYEKVDKEFVAYTDIKINTKICGIKIKYFKRIVFYRYDVSKTSGPYDYMSIMHYHSYDKIFRKNDMDNRFGTKTLMRGDVITDYDIEAIRRIY